MCANLRKKFWPLLNQPASHGPFRPKLWMPLATIFVEIFEKEKNWWGSGPIGVTSWKDFEISSKKWRFEFFCQAKASTFKMSMGSYLKNWVRNSSKRRQILYFTWSLPFLQWRCIFAGYEEWQTQILDFFLLLHPIWPPNRLGKPPHLSTYTNVFIAVTLSIQRPLVAKWCIFLKV